MDNKHVFFTLRADQYKSSPAKWFVTPPFDISSLDYGDHSIRLKGSRGCGKTMLFRSIAEQPFGRSLTGHSQEATTKIRVYIRPDNQLMNSFKGWDISSEVWGVASQELILLKIFREITQKLNYWLKETCNEEPLRFDYENFSFSNDGDDLQKWIRLALHNLYKWSRTPVGNPPVYIATLDSLHSLLATLPAFYNHFPKDFSVSIYIDELEIYQDYQQEQINDWIKNPPLGWVFHVAHRWYLEYTRSTSSNEKIEESNDYKVMDLDAPLIGSNPECKKARKEFYSQIILNEVGASNSTESIKTSKNLLPELSFKEICDELRKNKRAIEAWERCVKKSYIESKKEIGLDILKMEGNEIEDSRWWVFWPVLVARNNTKKIEDISSTSSKELLHNNILGSILQIYIESNGKAPLLAYTGFDRICSIVLSNVREFMLIIREAIENERISQDKNNDLEIIDMGISFENQAKAIQSRSRSFSLFVSISAHKLGFDVQQAIDNWCFYLRKMQSLPNLPYNEPNHCVLTDPADNNNSAWKTLQIAKRHGGFIFEKPSKLKNGRKDGQLDIRLHPLICAWKYLSYRKRNSPPLKFLDIIKITDAENTDDVEMFFLEKYSKEKKPTNFKLL